jgi:Ca2+-binding RTX toxin-like protein
MTNKKILIGSIIAGIVALLTIPTGIVYGGVGCGAPIYGTDLVDKLVGTNGNDCIIAYDGDDSIRAGAGNDSIYPGRGADTVNAGSGDDSIDLTVNPGLYIPDGAIDRVNCGTGTDTVYHADANDIFHGCENVFYGV